ncbi:MAG: hypothetical protein Q8P22_09270 [Chloroflexota bacterium]|nr:hypothetical protein [Chloroflexota bacterium]
MGLFWFLKKKSKTVEGEAKEVMTTTKDVAQKPIEASKDVAKKAVGTAESAGKKTVTTAEGAVLGTQTDKDREGTVTTTKSGGRKLAPAQAKSRSVEHRLEALEETVKTLTEILEDYICQDCSSLLVINPIYADGELVGYEAQCYDCGHIEEKAEPGEWHAHHPSGERKRLERRHHRPTGADAAAKPATAKQ